MNKKELKFVGAPAHRCPNNGITLIALIITIIVMLILVAVTISMAINGGLFEKSGEAVGKTQNEIDQEQEIANGGVNIDGTYYSSIDEYLKNASGETLISLYKSGELKVGDYVDYKPSTANAVNPDDPEGTGTAAAGTLTGYTSNSQSIGQEELTWRVLGADGDNLLLISGMPTTTGIYFYGNVGYYNYLEVLENVCSKLYSNSSIGGIARSITLNDTVSLVTELLQGPNASSPFYYWAAWRDGGMGSNYVCYVSKIDNQTVGTGNISLSLRRE